MGTPAKKRAAGKVRTPAEKRAPAKVGTPAEGGWRS